VWNVVAAPPDALTLKTWCFVLAGCVSYRGYFDIAEAQTLARTLQAQALEVGVYGVPAYSTLGWSNWVGGDPLLNTFIGQPDAEVARLLFHELAHQVVYVADDSMFNESFATAVERLGVAQWLARHASPEQRAQYAQREQRRQAFRALTQTTRRELAAVYARPSAQQSAADLAVAKTALMQQFRQQYADLKRDWAATAGQHPAASDAAAEAAQRAADAWVARANNASFAALGVYDELVPGFEALYAQDSAWDHFYATVRELAQRPKDERRRVLQAAVEAQSKLATKSM
jgi:predicted aminopeptidase